MRLIYINLPILLVFLFLFIGTGCQESPVPLQTTTTLNATVMPTTTPTHSPQSSDIQLSYPLTITLDDIFVVNVTNEGSTSYAYYKQHPADNCLFVLDEAGKFIQTIPGDTCDALAENIVTPGQSSFFSSWDLKRCVDNDCLTRELVAPGLYHFSGDFSPLEDNPANSRHEFTFEESFTILPASD